MQWVTREGFIIHHIEFSIQNAGKHQNNILGFEIWDNSKECWLMWLWLVINKPMTYLMTEVC